ncbi:MAG: hypothetical protein ACFWT6_15025 [Virgibacillus proomii]|jgi:hypothetical protein
MISGVRRKVIVLLSTFYNADTAASCPAWFTMFRGYKLDIKEQAFGYWVKTGNF